MAQRQLRSFRSLRDGQFRAVDYINLLALAVGIISGLFIITGTPIALILLPILAGLGLDGILRSHPAGRLRDAAAEALDLVTPVAFVFAAALFFRWAASGYWSLLAAIATAVLFGIVAYAAYYGQNAASTENGATRLAILGADYITLLAFLSVFYAHDYSYLAASLLAGVAATLVAIDIFRDAGLSFPEHALFALAAGVFVALSRWAIAYVRIDGILAAVLLLVAFYVGVGVTVAALTRRLDQRAGAEFVSVSVVGLLVVVIGRVVGGS